MNKPPLNYTTSIPTNRTIGECQDMLGRAGAAAVAVLYTDRFPSGLSFRLATASGPQDFALPVNIDGIHHLLCTADYPPSVKTKDLERYVKREHAVRVGWRVVRDWLEAQLAFVTAEMVKLDEVMLPYLQVGDGQTLYRALQSNRLALTAGGPQASSTEGRLSAMHSKPHFNQSGGCLCKCRKCVHVSLREHLDHVDISQLCVCKRCSQDCPSEGRIISAKAQPL